MTKPAYGLQCCHGHAQIRPPHAGLRNSDFKSSNPTQQEKQKEQCKLRNKQTNLAWREQRELNTALRFRFRFETENRTGNQSTAVTNSSYSQFSMS